ncbi:MAG TPA: hypothetical protein VKB45_04730 [Gemmatimonadales bacterium]|nr:hypothetical protein [Gemmatimonadales bacterium]
MPDALSLVAWVVDPDRREEVLGDLCELRARESVTAFWGDVLGVCLRAPRLRRWAGTAAALLLLGVAVMARDPRHRIVTARDAAGAFVLEFDGLRVVRATLDGAPVPAERLVQENGRVVIRGGAGNAGDLNIRLRPDGSFYWRSRAPQTLPTP